MNQPKNILGGVVCLLLFILSSEVSAQRIRIQGHITNTHGKSVPDVNIIDPITNERIEISDEDGRYVVKAEKSGSLKYTCIGYEDQTVELKSRQVVNVVLKDAVFELDEVTVTSKIKDKVVPEPTDIEIKGNYFHLKTRIPVPKELFSTNRRLVIQPSLYDINDQKRLLMRPMVFDGNAFQITQKRMYHGNEKNDPLHEYIVVKSTPYRQSDVLVYHDSIYIQELKHDYRADVHLAMENYRFVVYRDSFSIARGTVNPLRFLDYQFSASHITDRRYLPRPVMQLRDTQGEVNLTFVINQADLDDRNPQNQRELNRLNDELAAIEQNPDASLHSFHITGVASPDGSYAANLRLAKMRTDKALERILARLTPESRSSLKVQSDAEVASWDTVVALLRKDSLYTRADEIEELMHQYKSYRLNQALKGKPYYQELATRYLPSLRKVRYTYEYSIFRTLTDAEIHQLYQQRPQELTRFEYYRMIATAATPAEKERLCREAMALHHHFSYAANELAYCMIEQGTPDSRILQPFVSATAPAELLSNQIIALLDEGKYASADSLLSFLPETEHFTQLRAITGALAGYHTETFDAVAATSPLNKVVMLLAMKRNEEAWQQLQTLPVQTAREYYVKAIAANRLDYINEALICINKALELEPSLIETARLDGDVIDLLPEEQKIKEEN